jgi:hypothetical protein
LVVPFEKTAPEIRVNDFSVTPDGINIEITENGIKKNVGYKLN